MTQAASKSSCSKVGCIGLCVVVGLTLLLAQIFGPSIKIEGTTGTLSHTLNPLSTAHLEADNICWDVFDAAKRHPELTTINVDCDMESLFDRYGHPITPHEGTITVSDLDEVRRYTDSTAYAMDKAQEIEIQISSMPDANQLKQ